jgi:acyl carrier protein
MQTVRVSALFSEVLDVPVEKITDETSPQNTPEWDSLQNMNLVVALEAALGIRFATKEIISMKSVWMVREILKARGIENA